MFLRSFPFILRICLFFVFLYSLVFELLICFELVRPCPFVQQPQGILQIKNAKNIQTIKNEKMKERYCRAMFTTRTYLQIHIRVLLESETIGGCSPLACFVKVRKLK